MTVKQCSRNNYEYLVMLYGQTNAPAVFQSFVNKIFKELMNHSVIIFIDDILIYLKTYDYHIAHIHLVLNGLLQHHFFVKDQRLAMVP